MGTISRLSGMNRAIPVWMVVVRCIASFHLQRCDWFQELGPGDRLLKISEGCHWRYENSGFAYPLVMTSSSILNMAIEFVDLSIKDGDFP